MCNKKIICITGPDGSGKSTLIDQLMVHFPNSKKIGIWDAFASKGNKLFENKASIDDYLCKLSPIARTFFLTHALQESMKNVEFEQNAFFFLDSYFYKYYCSELTLGAPLEIIQLVSKYFQKPDLVISLNIDPSICAYRKAEYTRYECGLAKEPNEKTFVYFQNKCAPNWFFFHDKTWVNIDADNTSETILKTTIKNINIICKSI